MLISSKESGGMNEALIYVFAFLIIGFALFCAIKAIRAYRSRTAETHKFMSSGHFVALGFAGVIFLGSLLLFLPITHNEGAEVSYVESLFTSTSAVCVTGLVAFDTADTFNYLGQGIIALLIQIGGLGIASLGIGIMALSGRRVNMRDRYLVKEALNYSSFDGIMGLLRWVLMTTLTIELAGAVLSFFVFRNDYSPGKAIWLSIFHSIASFNNAGFDVIGGGKGLSGYSDNMAMNIITILLIVLGGIGFYAIKEILTKRSFRKLTLNTKVALATTLLLIVSGTLLFKLSENITWLGALFSSVTTRTAGFSTFDFGKFTNAGIIISIILMFVGASPGSTGGGVKTTTFFVLVSSVISIMTNRDMGAFKRKFKQETVFKAFLIFVTSIMICIITTYILSLTEPDIDFLPLLFESVSAFSTTGLSMGITAGISSIGKLVLVLTMYIGRIGPLTAVTLLAVSPQPTVSRAEESISIG